MIAMRAAFVLLIITGLYCTIQALIDARWVYADHVANKRNGNRQLFAAKAIRQEWIMLSIFIALFVSAASGLALPENRFTPEFLRDYRWWPFLALGAQMYVSAALTVKVLMRRYDRRLLTNILDTGEFKL